MYESRAKHRNWEQFATITGESPEHQRIRKLLQGIGPAAMLQRLRVPGGVKAVEAERQLQMLCFESVALPQAPAASDGKDRTPQLRYFMQVKDRQTGEACMYWEEPKPQRTTDPAQNSAHDDFTRKVPRLHRLRWPRPRGETALTRWARVALCRRQAAVPTRACRRVWYGRSCTRVWARAARRPSRRSTLLRLSPRRAEGAPSSSARPTRQRPRLHAAGKHERGDARAARGWCAVDGAACVRVAGPASQPSIGWRLEGRACRLACSSDRGGANRPMCVCSDTIVGAMVAADGAAFVVRMRGPASEAGALGCDERADDPARAGRIRCCGPKPTCHLCVRCARPERL